MEKIFEISTEIYSENAIRQAIVDFEEVAEIIFENQTLKIFGENEAEIDEVFHEFMNYLIGLFNQ